MAVVIRVDQNPQADLRVPQQGFRDALGPLPPENNTRRCAFWQACGWNGKRASAMRAPQGRFHPPASAAELTPTVSSTSIRRAAKT